MSDSRTSAPGAAAEILDDCVAGRVRKLARVVDRLYNEHLRPHGVRNTQLTLLAMLAYMGEAAPADLGDHLAMDKSSLSRTLARMQQAGWVEISGATGRLGLTAAGQELLSDALPAWRRAQEAAAERLGSARFTRLGELLRTFATERD